VEDQSSLLQSSMQEDSFEVVMRGYNKRQVDDYVLQCQHHIRDLAQRLALAEQEIERVRADAAVAIEKASSKPVHEEVSERLSQILRLANEEAERERANAADEIAALRAAALADTQTLRELAQRETDELRQQALAETEAQRQKVQAETNALRERVHAETNTLRERVHAETDALLRQAERDAADERERAQSEAERLVGNARASAERDLAEARAQAQHLEESARIQSEQLVGAAQERADTLIGEAERRATAINTVLGGRLEVLTATHQDVVTRLFDLRDVLVDILGREEAAGPFEVPPPAAETPAVTGAALSVLTDPYVQTAGEVAAAYEAGQESGTATWGSVGEDKVLSLDGEHAPGDLLVDPAATKAVDLSSVTEKTRR
jgi:cell division septum initiation protein DivIVA